MPMLRLLLAWIAAFSLAQEDELDVKADEIIRIPLEEVRVPLEQYKWLRSRKVPLPFVTPLENYYDLIYIGKVRLGSSSTEFRTLFDSGSNDIWYTSSECSTPFCNGDGRATYRVPSRLRHRQRIALRYAAGKVYGPIVTDSVNAGSVTAKDQSFVAADTVYIPDYFKFDGIIGMSPGDNGFYSGQTTFLTTLKESKRIRHRVFSFVLREYIDRKRKSYMLLGGLDPDLFMKPMVWIKSNNSLFWSVEISHVGFGSAFGRSTGMAIIDSGTSYIHVPAPILDGIHATIKATLQNDQWLVDCSRLPRMPTITLVINDGYEIQLFPEDYTCQLNDICYSNFLPTEHDDEDARNPDWILGAAFLRAYYVAFDMDKSRIGIAPYKQR